MHKSFYFPKASPMNLMSLIVQEHIAFVSPEFAVFLSKTDVLHWLLRYVPDCDRRPAEKGFGPEVLPFPKLTKHAYPPSTVVLQQLLPYELEHTQFQLAELLFEVPLVFPVLGPAPLFCGSH
ncbi:unnamed protein product [Haemonchus placei]|uniref:Uncharacterized protein n=1 Tax=Haemonchus placei TaxID=6290 RepID=A0A0N4WAH6_HAEPC|nr:unnamed protein product [Haemonchus placei]